jgi:hypothetical protein
MDGQILIAIDADSGNILLGVGPMKVVMSLRDALRFVACMSDVLAKHPQVQPRPEPQILVAGVLPRMAGGIDFDGR